MDKLNKRWDGGAARESILKANGFDMAFHCFLTNDLHSSGYLCHHIPEAINLTLLCSIELRYVKGIWTVRACVVRFNVKNKTPHHFKCYVSVTYHICTFITCWDSLSQCLFLTWYGIIYYVSYIGIIINLAG